MKTMTFEHFDGRDGERITISIPSDDLDAFEATKMYRRFMLAIGYPSFEGRRLELVPDGDEVPDHDDYREGYEDAVAAALIYLQEELIDRVVDKDAIDDFQRHVGWAE